MLFWLITMGIFDSGRIIMRVHQLTQAAREGARAASLAGDLTNGLVRGSVMEKVTRVLNGMGINEDDVIISIIPFDASGDGINEVVEVMIQQPIRDIIGVSIIPGLNEGLSISTAISMPILSGQAGGG